MHAAKPLKICYLPGRETSYSRNRVLIKAMREAGFTVLDCSYGKKNFWRYIISFFRFLKQKHQCDIIFVGFLGQFLMPMVKIFTRKKILFDAFLSVYQTMAHDRKSIKPKGILASLARFSDKFSCRLADSVIIDTRQHVEYFVKEYNISNDKIKRILVGSDDTVFTPRDEPPGNDFIVHFHGAFQALHGAKHIVEAAILLPDIEFQLIGEGKELDVCRTRAKTKGLKNINFIPPVEYEQLPEHMSRATICLGIFGDEQKAGLVIPHKVYEALAMGKPLITCDSPSMRELLTDRENAILCKCADAKSLAEAIVLLQGDPELRQKVAENGYRLFKEKCTPAAIGNNLLQVIQELDSAS